ncbi:Ig-like domain-containing protein [Serratia plymuthica]|uniref:Ig-like domain-containing protein n=1 Tax=Serratia plymuthica TaxID=82996 RepID=UPI003DA5514C
MTYKANSTYFINHRIITNNVQANGSATNVVEFTFTDSATFTPAVALHVVVEVDGNAIIKESNSAIYSTVTDGNGKTTVNITNTVAEEINVSTFVISSQSENDEVTVTFKPVSDRFYISSVTNANHTFTAAQPKIAWAGASFILHTEGGSGQIEWETKGATAEVIVEGNDLDRTAGVTILARTDQPCTIIATDTLSGESDQYILEVETFLQPESTESVSYDVAKSHHPDSLTSLELYKQLYTEWGDMTAYVAQGWNVDNDYWTSDEDFGSVTVFNLQNGTDYQSGTWFVKKHYCFIVG